MMKIQILHAGTFSDFIRPNKVITQQLAVGDVVDYPDWYAGCMVKMGRAEVYVEPGPRLIDATDAAFRLAAELDVDLLALVGSGKGGRITAGDVRKAQGP